MKYHFKVLVIAILVFCFGFSCCANAEDIAPCASELVSAYSITLTASDGKVTAHAKISAYAACDQIGYTSFRLQTKKDGDWETVDSAHNRYGYGVRVFHDSLSCAVQETGTQYRAVCYFYVKSGSLSDSFVATRSN